MISNWLSEHYIELFGTVSGIIYVLFEIKQIVWLWPLGIVTSGLYIIVFFTTRFYADMSLQIYYLVISVMGWYWWIKGTRYTTQGAGKRRGGEEEKGRGREEEKGRKEEGERGRKGEVDVKLSVTRLKLRTAIILAVVFIMLYFLMWFVLSRFTDSPVPKWDSFLTSLSIIATWMLARKIFEHWYLWIIVDSVSALVFCIKGLYPTVALYAVYCIMSFAGLREWRKSLPGVA